MLYCLKNKKKIKYTVEHKKAFLKIEKELLGHNTFRGYIHDLDKVILCCILPYNKVKNLHVKHSHHHNKANNKSDYIQMIIDWECARYTKPDKPLNARETLYKFYPQLKNQIEPILISFNL